MTSWHSYPKVWNLGHKALAELLDGPVIVQEKVDGSQFSFGVFDGQLRCRSRGQELDVGDPEKMFYLAVETAKSLAPLLHDGWTYRGEYFQKPKHNTLAYDRIPMKHVIIFDINDGEESYLGSDMVVEEIARLGLERVPTLYEGPGSALNLASVGEWLGLTSVLGGQKIEGVVVKNYTKFGPDKKALFGKHVSEAFKEIHQGEWKKSNPKGGDILDTIATSICTPARFKKAVQHLREKGLLTDSPKDIGPLMKELHLDVQEECHQEIVDQLMRWALPQIKRMAARGLPEWYKNELLQKQFESGDPSTLLMLQIETGNTPEPLNTSEEERT